MLFEQFDEDVQNEIRLFLEELCSIVEEAHRLLDRPARAANPANVAGEPSSRLSARLRWTLLDKKRVMILTKNFGELNSRILANIKLWCLSMSVGVSLHHLRLLEGDPNSRQLGFDTDARLKLAATDSEILGETFEIRDPNLLLAVENAQSFGDKFGIVEWNGTLALIERRSYAIDAPVPVAIDSRTRELVENLARLLRQPKELVFRMPSCMGWTLKPLTNEYSFIFAVPPGVQPAPMSLLQVLSLSESMKPSLGDKFRLALGLARCISQLQLVKWVSLILTVFVFFGGARWCVVQVNFTNSNHIILEITPSLFKDA